MKYILSTAVAIIAGIVVLLGYFIPLSPLLEVRTVMIGWAAILAGVASLVGGASLFRAHWNKLFAHKERDYYSLFMLVAFAVTLVAGFMLTPADPGFQNVVMAIQVPIETSLMAVLAVSLAYACLRLFQKRKGWMSVLFLLSVVFFLFLKSGLFSFLERTALFSTLFYWINQIPMAGARGILLGVALGSLVTGLRVLIGADRPYRG